MYQRPSLLQFLGQRKVLPTNINIILEDSKKSFTLRRQMYTFDTTPKSELVKEDVNGYFLDRIPNLKDVSLITVYFNNPPFYFMN